MGKEENKQWILDKLRETLQRTRAGHDVVDLRYIREEETVHVDFLSGKDGRVINVAMDSGIAMLKDVINNIDIG